MLERVLCTIILAKDASNKFHSDHVLHCIITNGSYSIFTVHYPRNLDLTNTDSFGLYASRHFTINYEDKEGDRDQIKLGAWHVLPNHIVKRFAKQLKVSDKVIQNITHDSLSQNQLVEDDQEEIKYKTIENLMGDNFDIGNAEHKQNFFESVLRMTRGSIVLYLHGNTGSRGALHRVELYKIMRRLGHHVLAIDYRGYADSTDIDPSESGVVRDALMAYRYLRNLTNSPIFLYGHSLGTGVSTHLAAIIDGMEIIGPKAVILEAPFNNIRDEIKYHPFSKLYRNLPWFEYSIINPMYDNKLRFESDQHIAEFRQPVLIMHAEDDVVVPFALGYKLYRTALETRGKSWGPVQFHRFDESGHYGHKFIVRSPYFPEIVQNFFKTYRDETF